MFLDLKFKVYAFLFQYGSDKILITTCFFIALISFILISKSSANKLKSVLLIFLTGLSAFFGARILHVLVENRALLTTPEIIFSRFDGMTFNGSLLFGFATFALLLLMFQKNERTKYWDMISFISAFSYGALRISCFVKGCCWGAISSVPWSVKYFESNVMPWHGIPVHPVQLYDSLLGFFILSVLIYFQFKKQQFKGHLFSVFLFLYAVGRFFTEFYRGDSFRGENIVFNLSTSQSVSIGILICLLIFHTHQKWSHYLKSFFSFGLLSLFITGCLPQAPQDQEFKSVQRSDQFEVYQTYKSKNLEKKNVLFLAGDDNIQFGFTNILKNMYKTDTPPKLEDLVYWEYVKNMKDIYNIIVRVPPASVGHDNFTQAIKYMESLGQSYDLIILTHGMPNYLSTGKGNFFSYKDFEMFKGQLTNLNLVMLQSCFGKSLVNDFKEAGAKHVLSYPDFNRNFFFFGFFLKYYYPNNSVEAAYELAKNNFDFQMGSIPYDQVASVLLMQQNQVLLKSGKNPISKSDLISSMPAPILD